jgi:hypothetical protein
LAHEPFGRPPTPDGRGEQPADGPGRQRHELGLIRRHDFVAEAMGKWAKAALYCDRHRQIGGLTFPTRRRALPRGPGGRVLFRPTLLALDFDEIEIRMMEDEMNITW